MAEEGKEEEYLGTEGSKYGKIVVARAVTRVEAPDMDPESYQDRMVLVDTGPHDKGFRSTKDALDRIQDIATAELEGKTWDDLPGRTLPDYFVLRIQQTVRVRPVQRVELEFDTD